MAHLFDDDEWPVDGFDAPLPSFLRDRPSDLPGPADVDLRFAARGATSTTITPRDGHASAEEPPAAADGAGAAASSAADADEWDPLFDPWPSSRQLPSLPDADRPDVAGMLSVRQQSVVLPDSHPSGPIYGVLEPLAPHDGSAGAPAYDGSAASAAYDVTLAGALGYSDLGFRDGHWFSLGGPTPRQLSTRDALQGHRYLAGPIVQVVCWWMREHPHEPRALDLATELALAVSELVREQDRSNAWNR
jgi:hypothetical protein